ncbi:MAG: single-stranded-DNA-specific exonuclease RecJ [bacterium]
MSGWLVKRTNPDFINYIAHHAAVSPVLAQVLVNRGINSPERARAFLNPDLGTMTDPFSLPDMDRAVDRIRKAAAAGEKVLIHGDYDADGITATTILILALRKLGIPCDYFIPNRFDHGYGFNREAINLAARTGASLIITVDCGINSFDEVHESTLRGIDVIVTDHHEPSLDKSGSCVIPAACAVVNPKRIAGNPIPLCGAGIALKLARALLGNEQTLEFFDLAALGTVADMVPLLEDNRAIVKTGLDLINAGSRTAIAFLREAASIEDRTITSGRLSYTIIPRINASGRVGEASDVVKFFLSEDRDEAFQLARKLNSNNSQRYRIEDSVFHEALAMLKEKSSSHCIVLAGENWHEGVIGIVASKIADMFNRPTYIFSIKQNIARGSARSIPSFDVCRALSLCSDCLIRYGGHKQAAGLTMDPGLIPEFEKRMNEIFAATLDQSDLKPLLLIDAEVSLRDVNFPFIRELAKIEPFGFGNEEPLFAAKNLAVIEPRIVGKNHLKMKLKHSSYALDAIGFDMGDRYESLESSGTVDAVFVPGINEWNGGRVLQLTVRAIRPSM